MGCFVLRLERPKAEALVYPEANATATATARAGWDAGFFPPIAVKLRWMGHPNILLELARRTDLFREFAEVRIILCGGEF